MHGCPASRYVVAIHASLAGGDPGQIKVNFRHQVAIHASLAGGDQDQLDGLPVHDVAIHASLAGGDAGDRQRYDGECVAIHASLAGGDPDTSNVVARHTIEGKVREPGRPSAWRVYRSRPAGPVSPCRSTICGERAKLQGES